MNRHDYQILQACEDLHGYTIGSYDISDEDAEIYADWLHFRLKTWEESSLRTEAYDNAVKELIETTLADYENH